MVTEWIKGGIFGERQFYHFVCKRKYLDERYGAWAKLRR